MNFWQNLAEWVILGFAYVAPPVREHPLIRQGKPLVRQPLFEINAQYADLESVDKDPLFNKQSLAFDWAFQESTDDLGTQVIRK